jgi:hypothetical protein
MQYPQSDAWQNTPSEFLPWQAGASSSMKSVCTWLQLAQGHGGHISSFSGSAWGSVLTGVFILG